MEAFFKDLILDLYENFRDVFLGIIVMVMIMVGGLFVSWALRKLAEKILRLFRFDEWARAVGITEFLSRGGISSYPSVITGKIIFWISIVAFFSFGLNFIGISQFTEYASKISNALPHIFVSIVILVVGIIFSNFLGRVIYMTCENAGLRYSEPISKSIRAFLIIVTLGIVFEYLGIGGTLITIGVLILFGGIVLSLSLAIGIGLSPIVSELIKERIRPRGGERSRFEKEHPKPE
jgi:uncharacterized membrane protein